MYQRFLCPTAVLLSVLCSTAKNVKMHWIKPCKIKTRIFCSLGFITGMCDNLQTEGQDCLWSSCLLGATQEGCWSAWSHISWGDMSADSSFSVNHSLHSQAPWSEPVWSWAYNQSCWLSWHLYESHCLMPDSRKDKGPEMFMSLQDAKWPPNCQIIERTWIPCRKRSCCWSYQSYSLLQCEHILLFHEYLLRFPWRKN